MKTFQHIKKNIHLSPEKKEEMWSSIVEKIALWENSSQENVRMKTVERLALWGTHSNSSSLSPNQKNMVTKIITSVLIAGSIIGTSFAAEQAVPGDALYAFKVGVNESVRWAFYVGTERNAQWEIKKIERRAQEKKELEAQSNMTVRTEAEIQTRTQDSVEKVQEVILKLQTEWKAEAATSLEDGLNTAINAIIEANTRRSNTSSDVGITKNVDVEIDWDTEVSVSRDSIVEIEWDLQSDVHSDVKSENSSGSSSRKSDLDIQGELDLLAETR